MNMKKETPEKEALTEVKKLTPTQMVNNMLIMQATFNTKTNGITWINNITKENFEIDWMLNIHDEIWEMMKCFPIEHWKDIKKEFDKNNYEVEVVDTFHFIMSHIINIGSKMVIEKRDQERIDKKLDLILYSDQNKIDLGIEASLTVLDFETYRENLKFILDEYQPDDLKSLKTLTRSFAMTGDDIDNIVSHFMLIMLLLERDYNFDLEKLYKLYIGKNALNVVRQNNGYKIGEYTKIWKDGKEDNVFMREYVLSLDASVIELELVIAALEEMYGTIIIENL